MILTLNSIREIEHVDRRVLGAFRLVDQTTGAPLVAPGAIETINAAIIDVTPPGPPTVVSQIALGTDAVEVRQNRRGWFVLFRAPRFEAYTHSFEPPSAPDLQASQRLRLRLAITDAGSNHLPRFFDVLLPRSLDPDAAENIFTAQAINLLRAPAASVFDGWAVLRVTVRQTGTQTTLPGVLLRVFRSPRAANPEPIAIGMTEWRNEHVRGEAVVPIPGLQRFIPGGGANVFETTHTIELEATRDQDFPDEISDVPAVEQLPDVDTLIAGVGANLIRRSQAPANPALTILRPALPLTIAAGEERVVELEMP